MKKYLKPLTFLLVIIFCYSLTACGSSSNEQAKDYICKNHKDTDNDGICDTIGCSETVSSEEKNDEKEEQDNKNNTDKEEDSKQEPEQKPAQTPEQAPENPPQPNAPCEVCVDLDENLICDICNNEIIPQAQEPAGALLVKDGKTNFSVLLEYDNLGDDEISKINEFISFLEGLGISPEIYSKSDSSNTETKIIINSVSFLGEEYKIDPHYLGPKGYAVKAENNEILLRAGSTEALVNAIEYLKEKAFSQNPTENAVFLFTDSVELIQTDYKFTGAFIKDYNIKDYKITYGKDDEEGLALSKKLQTALYENVGIWLPIIPETELNGERYISLKSSSRSGSLGFYAKITEVGCLEIISEFKNKTLEAGKEYISSVFGCAGDTVEFTEKEINTRDIFYKDFGAVGDGKTNDIDAIRNAHNYANEYGHTVIADSGAKYYIGKTIAAVSIRTDTFWNKATFIIDDRELTAKEAKLNIFTIESAFEPTVIDDVKIKAINGSGGFTRDTERINLSLGYSAILIIGSDSKTESVLVDGDGYIINGHALSSDFKEVKTITVIRADDTEITVDGGRFITYSNQTKGAEPFVRNIKVNRSNTIVRNITYEIEYEPKKETGASPYLAFIEIVNAYNVSVSDFTFSARKEYVENRENPIISALFSHKITLSRCDQDIDTFFAQDGFSQIEGFAGALRIYSSKDLTVADSLINELYFDESTYLITVKNVKTHKTESVSGDINVTAIK